MDRQPTVQPEPTDDVLVAKIVRRDLVAFSLIYDRYARTVFVMAAHMLGQIDAEEVVQEAFIRLWNKAHQFDPQQGSFAAWFMTIARNCAMNEIKSRTQQQRIASAEEINVLLTEASRPAVDMDQQVWMNQRAAVVMKALENIPEEQRRVIVLAYFGGFSQSQIARQLRLPLGTVKKRIRLGLQKLRMVLTSEGTMAKLDTGSERV